MAEGEQSGGRKQLWQSLRSNPDYRVEWRAHGGAALPPAPAPFLLRAQSEADLMAARWGLLAWEDPPGQKPRRAVLVGRADAGGPGWPSAKKTNDVAAMARPISQGRHRSLSTARNISSARVRRRLSSTLGARRRRGQSHIADGSKPEPHRGRQVNP